MNRRERRTSWLSAHRNAGRHNAIDAKARSGAGHLNAPIGSLHIGELVLHGFPPAAAPAIGDTAQIELTRMLAAAKAPAHFQRDASQLGGATFQVPSNAPSQTIGRLIAKAIYGGGK
jgi:hypothetical protein